MAESLSQLSTQERLAAVDTILTGCNHLYSKGKLQKEKLTSVLPVFMKLAYEDPLFLAHFTSYVIQKSDNKDLKLLSVFANSLSDADGTPFSVGSKYKKPNFRTISAAAVQTSDFNPKLVWRLIELASMKLSLGEKHKEGSHFSKTLQTAIKKYMRFRESNPKALESLMKNNFGTRFRNLYKTMRIMPSEESQSIIGFRYKGKTVKKKNLFDFSGLSDLEIAQKIRNDKIPGRAALGALPDKISPVIAVAVLEQCTGNEAVILRELFDSQGILKNPEVMKLFESKIREAKTALDRVDRLNTEIDERVMQALKSARSEVRKKQAVDFGKVFLHIDVSSSMEAAINMAKEYSATIAECVPNPENNFFWGLFAGSGRQLAKPETFEKDAFKAALYTVKASGNTNLFGCWENSRKENCDVDIFITDCDHNVGSPAFYIRQYPNKPKVVGIVNLGSTYYFDNLKRVFEQHDIPVAEIKTSALNESALIVQTLKEAIKGREVLVEEILNTPLLKLPSWWEAVKI